MKKLLLIGSFVCIVLLGCGPEEQPPQFSAVFITLDEGEISRPTVAVAENDDAVFWAWIRKDDDGWNVYVSTLDETGVERSDPLRVNHIPGNASPHAQAPAQIAVGPEGNVYVAWTNSTIVEGRRFPASDLLMSRSLDGGRTWSEEEAINSDAEEAPSGHTFHDILAMDDGTILVSWIDSRERDRFSTSSNQEASQGSRSAHEGMHAPTTDESGRNIGSEIWMARSRDGGLTFEETVVVDSNACPCCRTNLAAAPDGSVYLAWRHEFENGARDIVVSRSDDSGSSFSEPVRVSEDNWVIEACPHAGPALAVDTEGNVHVSWFTAADSGVGLFRTVSTNGGRSFQPRESVVPDQGISHTSFARMGTGAFAMASETLGPSTISVSLIATDTGHSAAFEDIKGRSPSFSGNGRVSAIVFENGGSIESRIWRQLNP